MGNGHGGAGQVTPKFVSRGQKFRVVIGDTVRLPCQVDNLGKPCRKILADKMIYIYSLYLYRFHTLKFSNNWVAFQAILDTCSRKNHLKIPTEKYIPSGFSQISFSYFLTRTRLSLENETTTPSKKPTSHDLYFLLFSPLLSTASSFRDKVIYHFFCHTAAVTEIATTTTTPYSSSSDHIYHIVIIIISVVPKACHYSFTLLYKSMGSSTSKGNTFSPRKYFFSKSSRPQDFFFSRNLCVCKAVATWFSYNICIFLWASGLFSYFYCSLFVYPSSVSISHKPYYVDVVQVVFHPLFSWYFQLPLWGSPFFSYSENDSKTLAYRFFTCMPTFFNNISKPGYRKRLYKKPKKTRIII